MIGSKSREVLEGVDISSPISKLESLNDDCILLGRYLSLRFHRFGFVITLFGAHCIG